MPGSFPGDTVSSARNPFSLVSALPLMASYCRNCVLLLQVKNESDNNKIEAEKFKKEVDSLKQEMELMKKDYVERGPSISEKNENEWITGSSLSLLNQQEMTPPNFDAENPYFETCGIRISLRGHNHPDSVTIQHSLPSDLEHFDILRREGKEFDKQIIIGDVTMNDLLIGRIAYFKNLMSSNWREASSDIIKLSCEFDSTIIESIINWAYSGVISINLENVQVLMRAASYLRIESIIDECYLFMRRRIQFDDALPLLHFCRAIDYNKNEESLIKFIESNFLLVSYSPDFLELSFDDLVNLINRNSLNVDNDEQVLDAVNRLLKSVGCPRLSSSFLNDIVEKKKWIIEIPECIALINEAQDEASNSLISLKSLPWNCGHSLIFVIEENEDDVNHDDLITVKVYDTMKNEWHQGQIEYRRLHKDNAVIGNHLRMPSLVDRRISTTGVIDGIIYSTGGYPDDYGWTRLADMSKEWIEAASCVLDGKFYVIGGYDYDYKDYENDCEYYDPASDKWISIANIPHERGGSVAATLGGEIYVATGYVYNISEKVIRKTVDRIHAKEFLVKK